MSPSQNRFPCQQAGRTKHPLGELRDFSAPVTVSCPSHATTRPLGCPIPWASAGQALHLLLSQALHSAAARKLWGQRVLGHRIDSHEAREGASHWLQTLVPEKEMEMESCLLTQRGPSSPRVVFSTSPFSLCAPHPSLKLPLLKDTHISQVLWAHRALLDAVWAKGRHSVARGGLEVAGEPNWGAAREEGIFPLFLQEEGGSKTGSRGGIQGAAESPGPEC